MSRTWDNRGPSGTPPRQRRGDSRPLRTVEREANGLAAGPVGSAAASATAPRLQVSFLGGFRTLVGGRPVPDDAWGRAKARQLFKCLLTRPRRRLTKDEAIELFWPDSDPAKADQTLRSVLSAIRNALRSAGPGAASDLIAGDQGFIRLRPDVDVWLDADAFERLLDEARRSSDPLPLLERADALYAGDYLPDDPYEDWAAERREALKRAWTELQFELAGRWEAAGDPERAAAALHRLLRADPCDERAAQALIRLLTRQGRRSEALRVYRRLVQVLRDELDAEPSPATAELGSRLMVVPAAVPSSVQPARPLQASPSSLPAQVTSFVGREREVAAARDLLLRPDVRLLTLTGPGGTGKTRLAVQVAAEVAERFEDGVAFVDLAPIADPALVVPTIARTLGVREIGGRTLAASLRDALLHKHVLLLLDNFEQVLAAARAVAELLNACPRLKVLATSRAVLGLYGEHAFEVLPLALPPRRPLPPVEELARNPAVRLFVERAQATRTDFALAENAASVVAICRRLDGLPLAIELAAARLKLLTPEAMLARLTRRLALLTGGARDRPERHQALRRTIDWSYDLLADAEKRLFRRLAVFVGGCSLEAVVAVVGGDGGLEAEVELLDGLQSLLDQSLLRRADDGAVPRFTMLATIREYALEQLVASGEADAARRRHAEWCLALAGADQPPTRHVFPTRPSSTTSLDTLEREHGNLRAALQWLCRNNRGDEALRLATALFDLWYDRGFFSEGLTRLREVLALPSAADRTETRAFALYFAGVLSRYAGEPLQARACHAEALEIFREVENPSGQIQVLAALGQIAGEYGDLAAAHALQEQALALARQVGDRRATAWTLHGLGQTAERAGDRTLAWQLHEESLAIRRELGQPWDISWSVIDLAYLAIERGDRATARAILAGCPALRGQDDTPPAMAAALECGAALAILEVQPERALRLLGAAAALREASGASPVGRLRERVIHLSRAARAGLEVASADAAEAAGRAMTPEEAAALALDDPYDIAARVPLFVGAPSGEGRPTAEGESACWTTSSSCRST